MVWKKDVKKRDKMLEEFNQKGKVVHEENGDISHIFDGNFETETDLNFEKEDLMDEIFICTKDW